MVSYRIEDPTANWLGLAGHIIGWTLFYLLGLAAFFLPFFCGWQAYALFSKKKLEGRKQVYYGLLTLSTALLLAQMAGHVSSIGFVYRDYFPKSHQLDPNFLRFYLGGVPLHKLYCDTSINFQKILGSVGSCLLFLTLFGFALFNLIKVNWKPVWFKIKSLIPKKIPAMALPVIKREPFEPQVIVRDDPLEREVEIKIPQVRKIKPIRMVLGDYALPPSDLLTEVERIDQSLLKGDLKKQAGVLEETLASFGIEAKVGDIHCGPTITSFEVHPAFGVKVQKIKALEKDIALNLQAKSIRIIAPIPGKAAVGIEVPNPHPQEVSFREMLEGYQAGSRKGSIPLLLGKMVNGEDVWADLTKMPHLIIAGATGSGKSVCINTIVMSIVMNARPDEIKLVMIDPKKVELTGYTHLPHMLAPVITEPGGATAALNWLVREMEKRYEIFRILGIRNIHSFNTRERNTELEESIEMDVPEKMPFIVVIIDELADLMLVSSSDIETPIARIAQMARAVGIHLILATQRPSREVITGLIKANFPCRIAFKVASRVNSQIIIDENGADSLLGNGDMLFLPPGTSTLIRAQGAFIRDEDINRVIAHSCEQAPTQYVIPNFDNYRDEGAELLAEEVARDPLFEEAKSLVYETGTASTTFLQRKLKIGYARAAGVMDQLEAAGVIGPSQGAKPRKIYYPSDEE
ncbi:MAG: DNA translocase FtsK [Chlamydiae bacterium]|nr:DNA translocase FtsK [Chlamydiota bacterium]